MGPAIRLHVHLPGLPTDPVEAVLLTATGSSCSCVYAKQGRRAAGAWTASCCRTTTSPPRCTAASSTFLHVALSTPPTDVLLPYRDLHTAGPAQTRRTVTYVCYIYVASSCSALCGILRSSEAWHVHFDDREIVTGSREVSARHNAVRAVQDSMNIKATVRLLLLVRHQRLCRSPVHGPAANPAFAQLLFNWCMRMSMHDIPAGSPAYCMLSMWHAGAGPAALTCS